jgi:hypothetical protein
MLATWAAGKSARSPHDSRTARSRQAGACVILTVHSSSGPMRYSMMSLFGRAPFLCAVACILPIAVAASCTSSEPTQSGECVGPACPGGTPTEVPSAGGGMPGAPDVDVGTGGTQPQTGKVVCGPGCLGPDKKRRSPDDPEACVSGSAGASGAEPSAGGAGGVLGQGGAAAEATPSRRACGVVRKGVLVTSACVPAGFGEVGAPCASSADCSPGLACVGEAKAGQCREYCCGGVCPNDEHCATRPLLELTASDFPVDVPVCVTPENCRLDEPYPCKDDRCTCPEGTACTLVGKAGLTACREPGSGAAGEACPCAPGFVCSSASQTCLQLCSLEGDTAWACPSGLCQASPDLPPGFGTCATTAAYRSR